MDKKRTILLVDDNVTQTVELQSLLKNERYSVETVSNVIEALGFLTNCTSPPDIILSDIFMPYMNGVELCAKVRKDYPNLPFIILTAHNDENNLKKAFESGAVDYLVKPFSKTEILIRVANVLKKCDDEEKLKKEIVEHSLAKKELEASEKKSRAYLEHSPVYTKIVDLDFNLQYMSTAGIKALNVEDITQFYGKPYPFDFYPESFRNVMNKI